MLFLRSIRQHSGALLFVLGFVLLCSVYEYGRVMNMPPSAHHLSRQTTGLSLAYTYWDKGNDLLDPQLQHLFADQLTSGRAVAEFPLLYYVVGQIWRITGPSELVYRSLMLLLHFLGSAALFVLFRRVLEHAAWAAMVSLFFFTSPTIVYFAIGFMPDVPSFDLVLIALAVLWARGVAGQTRIRILCAAALFLLAALLKVTALMVPLTLLAMLLAEVLAPRWMSAGGGLFRYRGWSIAYMLLLLFATYSWYSFAEDFSIEHGAAFSHSGTWALWDLPKEDALRAWTFGKQVLIYQLFDTPAWIMFGGMLLFLLVNARYVPRQLWLALLILATGIVLYILLWFITLEAHEYYYIHPMILLILLFGTFLWTLKSRFPRAFSSPPLRILFLLLLAYHAVYAANNHLMRTRGNVALVREDYLPLINDAEARFWDLTQYWTLKPMLTIEPYLRCLGVQHDDLVMCMSDQTVCASLYFIHQEGWVDFGANTTTPEAIEARIRAGAKYLLLFQDDWVDRPELQRFRQQQIGLHEGMRVFDLRQVELSDISTVEE